MKKTILKKIFLMTISFVAVGFFVYFFWRYGYRSRASTIKATLNFTDQSITFKQNEEKNINFTLTTESPNIYKISGIDLYFKFNLNNKDLLDFVDFSALSLGSAYFDDVLKKEVFPSTNYGGCKILRITAVAKKPDSQLSGVITFFLRFKAKKTAGSSNVSLHASVGDIQNQVVGITGVQDNLFDLRVNNDATNYTVNTNASCSSSSSDCGQNASCSSSQCQCNANYYNCDGNWNNGCESSQICTSVTNTPTPTNTPIPTPTGATGNITLNLKLKFQGITQKPQDQYNRMKVKITAVSSSSQGNREADFVARDISDNKKGIWEGTVSLNLIPGNGYKLLIKGPKHIQKKICVNNPSETHPGTYTCSDGRITLNSGTNNLDLSNIYLSVGDLPPQDGFVNSYDLALVRNNLGKTDAEALRLADLNLDGRVNTQDYSLIMEALAVRSDEQ